MALNNYDPKMFLLSIASCAGSECQGPYIDLNVYCAINQALRNKDWQLEGWEIVWGPSVRVMQSKFTDQPQVYPTDVMFVARNASSYFVSVAATNYMSVFDVEEDFEAQTMRPWPYAPKGRGAAGKISRGFHESLMILQTLRPSNGLPGERLPLRDFLAKEVQEANGNVTIITGGHSQGGATSPLVALWLLDTQTEWDPEPTKATISCRRSAGPTPGDDDFAAYYKTSQLDTISLVNPLDFVTKIFVKSEMRNIRQLYEPDITSTQEIRKLVRKMEHLADTGRYTQIAYEEHQLYELTEAHVNMGIYDSSPTPTRCQLFARQMGYQHAQAYFELLGFSANIDVKQFDGICGS
jgi:Lipase (class 3)